MADILGTNGNDRLSGTKGNDFIRGMDGDDIIAGNDGNDVIRGGTGNDFILGGRGDDFVRGRAGDDIIYGGAGSDYLRGGNGRDKLSGDFGTDKLNGGADNDLFYFDNRTAGYNEKGLFASDTIEDFGAGDVIHFGNYNTSLAVLSYQQSGANTLIYVDKNGDGTVDYLAVTVLNANVSAVQSATSFGDFDF